MNDAVQSGTGRRNNRTLWILIAVFAVPYVAAMILYFGDFAFLKGKTSNYGELVSPVRPLGDIFLERLDDERPAVHSRHRVETQAAPQQRALLAADRYRVLELVYLG